MSTTLSGELFSERPPFLGLPDRSEFKLKKLETFYYKVVTEDTLIEALAGP